MGGGRPRSPYGHLHGPLASALHVAQKQVDVLVQLGPQAYASKLEEEASWPGRHDLTTRILDVVAAAVRTEAP